MNDIPVPLLPGFHPDPSVVRVGDEYFLATSTFEYLPGIPIYRSSDLRTWTLAGHVVTRPGQLQMAGVPTGGGAWAPTIRWHDGLFHLVVTDAMGRGTLLFTAPDPAGPWSDGLRLEIAGIDPDIAWNDDGTCYVTFSGLQLGEGEARHLGIQQVRIDLSTGRALEPPRSLWSGTGLIFPEAPHLYRANGWWYLLIAEGGTERGHAVSIARSTSPAGPFEGCPANPLLTASGSDRPAQCTGHGDLVQAPDGSWMLLLLGVWVRGLTRAFGSLGRETFMTEVTWHDGWPAIEPVSARERSPVQSFADRFEDAQLGPEWIGVRRLPAAVGSIGGGGAELGLVVRGEGRTMDHPEPTFIGRRQTRLDARISISVSERSADCVGGLTVRFDEEHHYDIEVQPGQVVARAVLPSIHQEQARAVPDGPLELCITLHPPGGDGLAGRATSDLVDLVAVVDGEPHVVATYDGRYLSTESACSFTGRVAGIYCVNGELHVAEYREDDL